MKKAVAVIILAITLVAVPLGYNYNSQQNRIQRIEKTMPPGEVDSCREIQETVNQEILDKEGWTFNQCILAYEK